MNTDNFHGRASGAPDAAEAQKKRRGMRYAAAAVVLAALWWTAYRHVQAAAAWLVFDLFGLEEGSHTGAALEFFLYDTAKILLLLAALIYVISWLRAALGYLFGAMFGAVTPFCSCSSVPLFLGFTTAGIPLGMTMAFLITSPIINEIAVILLWGLLGWKFTLVYVTIGITAGVLGGLLMDGIRAERWLRPFVLEAMKTPVIPLSMGRRKLTVLQRHAFARQETATIFRRVWKWVIVGVAVGAALHGLVPEGWFAENLGAGEWWTVPVAVLVGIPLYSNVTGIIPVMEGLLTRGMPTGTTMAFCMSAVAASIPELILLRQVMTPRLQTAFLAYLWLVFTLSGWLLNALF